MKRWNRQDRGSMAILMMVTLVGLMLSALLVPMIITQARTTRFDSTRVQELNAAQGGIDVMLGTIRAAGSSGIGTSSQLPCGPQSGVVNGTGSVSDAVPAYNVVVEYFTNDPVNEPYPSANAMKCVSGYGTFDPATSATTPGFARLTSTGTVGTAANGSSPSRTLIVTYVFRTSDVNILGGPLQLFPNGSTSLCMDAGSAIPLTGTAVLTQACSSTTPPAPQQVFAYRTDLTLQLVSSITAANAKGLCLDTASTPAVSGDAVRLAVCGPLGTPIYTQQWSFNDEGKYEAAQANSATTGTLAGLCMNVAAQAAGQPISLGTCGSNWIPAPSVGPGAAALPQWVNFGEFGRCMDVTGLDPAHSFMIDFPCKENPFPGARTWNQLFQAPAIPAAQSSVTGQISTCNSSPATTSASVCAASKYCLTSPGTNGGYVTTKACVSGSALQTWTIYDGDNTLSYSTKYTVVSGSLCLGLSVPNADQPAWSTIDVETCTGATEQKWNAVPNVLNSTLTNMHER